MWILIKILMISGHVWRRLFFDSSKEWVEGRSPDGWSFRLADHSHKQDTVFKYELWVSLPNSLSFQLFPENSFLKRCVRWGLGSEMQTGDTEFDDTFFISTENSFFVPLLARRPTLRKLLLELYRTGWTEITSSRDGLTLKAQGNVAPDATFPQITQVRQELSGLKKTPSTNSYIFSRFIVEALAMAGVGYLAGALIQVTLQAAVFLYSSGIYQVRSCVGVCP